MNPMSELVTLIAHTQKADLPGGSTRFAGLKLRPAAQSDVHQLGSLYFDAYDPGIACESLEEAIADIQASFNGEYGDFWSEASPVVESDSEIVAAIMTVRRAPWNDIPDCPFIVELFTSRNHRRMGLARLLVEHCRATVETDGEAAIALRVAEDNTPARTLYESLGFVPWTPPATPTG